MSSPPRLRLLDHLACLGSDARVLPPAPLKSTPTVTVVIPCYNYRRFLHACVASALTQTNVEVEVLIVDDASTDGSDQVADEIALADPRVRVIHHAANKGHIATFNDGLDQATGEYIVLISADDLLSPGSLSRAVSVMETHPSVGMVYGHAIAFTSDPPPTARERPSHWLVWPGERWLELRFRAAQNCVMSPEVVLRASVQRAIGGYRTEVQHTSDLDMWLRAAHVADVGYVAGADQAWYRDHATNMHKTLFSGDSVIGHLVDAKERARTFELVAATVITERPDSERLLDRARRAIAIQVLTVALRSFHGGQAKEWPLDDVFNLAQEVYPQARRLPHWRALALHRRLGSGYAHRDPLSLVHERAVREMHRGRRWRLERAGI